MGYADPYLGSRAPEYINYTFGIQHQWSNAFTSTFTYVGSQGHFLASDGSNARGFWANQLDPKYQALGTNLTLIPAPALTADLLRSQYARNMPGQLHHRLHGQLSNVALKPFPFQAVGDSFGYVANSNYNALQTTSNMARFAWYHLHRQLHMVAFHRQWRNLPFRLRYSSGVLQQRQVLESRRH